MAKSLMRAALLGTYGQPQSFSVQQVPTPVPTSNQLLVKVAASPINPSDLGFIMGKYAFKRPLPAIPGNECSGTVALDPSGTMQGRRVACLSESTAQGAWAEYVLTARENAVLVPDGVNLRQAACFFVNPLTAAMFRHVLLSEGHKAVLQTAAGSALGKMLTRVCARLNLPIVNIVRRPAQAASLQAEHVLCSSDSHFPTQLLSTCRRLQVTCAFDAVSGDLSGQVLTALEDGGVLYMYGSLSEQPANNMLAADFIFKRKRAAGLFLTAWLRTLGREERLGLYRDTMADLPKLYATEVSREFPLEEVQKALDFYQNNMSLGKVLISPGSS